MAILMLSIVFFAFLYDLHISASFLILLGLLFLFPTLDGDIGKPSYKILGEGCCNGCNISNYGLLEITNERDYLSR